MNRLLHLVCFLTASCFLGGCATNRIERHPDVFKSFPPDVQENVKQGRIEVGYSKAMVYMSLGNPDRVYTRQTEDGLTTIWAYEQVAHYYHGMGAPYYLYYNDPYRWHYFGAPFYWHGTGSVRDVLRVEFQNERVVAIEQEQP